MNYRLLHVSITPELIHTPKPALERRMNDLGRDWITYNAFSWVLWTNKSILTVSEMIMGDVHPGDQVLVVALNPAEVPNGRLPAWMWAWFNRPRNAITGDVETPTLPAPDAQNLFIQPDFGFLPPTGPQI